MEHRVHYSTVIVDADNEDEARWKGEAVAYLAYLRMDKAQTVVLIEEEE